MRVLIDADGCPVVDISIQLCAKSGVECILLCDTSHVMDRKNARTITVSKGSDSVDFALVNLVAAGDIVVTQDYGLAAMCLARNALPMNQDGMWYTEQNIDGLLSARHFARKVRNSGGRLKGPHARTQGQNQAFSKALEEALNSEQQ